MAIEELSSKLEKEELEKRKRYPLLDIVNNREELADICNNTIEYCREMYKNLEQLPNVWELLCRISIETTMQYYKLIDSKKEKGKNVYIKIGEFMTIGIEYGETNADKLGTFNPIITIGPELMYYNDDPDKNQLSKVPPVFTTEEQEQFDFVAKNTQNSLKNYGIIIDSHLAIQEIYTSFLRVMRDWLIKHKDDGEYGVDIYLGTVLDIGIAKEDTDNGVEYIIQFAPGQSFKFDNAKSDDGSEKESEK